MLRFFTILLVVALSAAGYFWWQGGTEELTMPEEPVVVEQVAPEPAPAIEQPERTGEAEEAEAAEDAVEEETLEETATPLAKGWQPRELTPEQEEFITDINDWMAQTRLIIRRIRRLYAFAKGAPVELKEEIDLREEYTALTFLTEHLSIPDEYRDSEKLFQEFDETLGEAVSLLSPEPALEELEAAIEFIDSLNRQTNELNRIINEIRY